MQKPARFHLAVNDELTLTSDNARFGQMIERIKAVAKMDVNVLIVGSPGSGKELVAEAIHRGSRRKGRLVTVNCTAMVPSLLESELFGHVKGAYTGAESGRNGRFHEAHHGTLFLDEICHMDVHLQAKLLRVVEYGEFYQVGSDSIEKTSARIIAAVNLDLPSSIQTGRLRRDLYYRLASYIIKIPDLHERQEDVERLVEFFVTKICKPMGVTRVEPECLRRLTEYPWPGNVRELQAVIRAAAINSVHRSGSSLTLQDLDPFPSELVERPGGATADDDIASKVCAGDIGLDEAIANSKRNILCKIRDLLEGDTRRIARATGKSENAIRSLFAREGLALGRRNEGSPKSEVCALDPDTQFQ